MEKQRGHVVVLTYPAQGHINPLLQFAKRLASKGLKATLATTHYTVASIHGGGVAIEPISDGYDQGGYKQAPNLESYLESFKTAGSRTLTELVLKFRDSNSPVTCLVYDSLLPWGLGVARQLGLYGAVFLTNSASVCSMYWQIRCGVLTLPVGDGTAPLSLPGLPPLQFSEMPSFLAEPASHSAYLAAIMEKFSCLEQNDWVFVNTFQELESELAKVMLGLWPVEMVGPMVPSMFLDQQIEGDTNYGASLWNPIGDQCLTWLDTKPPKSVVYVSFGSMAEISAEQVEEIAWGLKGCNKNFLWVLRDPDNEKLPTEFLNSADDQMGLIITWCNQLEVLSHQAVGCFVTHCGWNSILEGLSLGVPMVAAPQWSDQPTNAKYVEEVWKAGVRAKKDGGGVVRREELEGCIREVMVGERSEEIRSKVSMWRELAKRAVSRGGSSDQNVENFVKALLIGEDKPS